MQDVLNFSAFCVALAIALFPSVWFCHQKYARQIRRENARLSAAIAPLLQHALAEDKAPPIRFSVEDCRKIKEKVNGSA